MRIHFLSSWPVPLLAHTTDLLDSANCLGKNQNQIGQLNKSDLRKISLQTHAVSRDLGQPVQQCNLITFPCQNGGLLQIAFRILKVVFGCTSG